MKKKRPGIDKFKKIVQYHHHRTRVRIQIDWQVLMNILSLFVENIQIRGRDRLQRNNQFQISFKCVGFSKNRADVAKCGSMRDQEKLFFVTNNQRRRRRKTTDVGSKTSSSSTTPQFLRPKYRDQCRHRRAGEKKFVTCTKIV